MISFVISFFMPVILFLLQSLFGQQFVHVSHKAAHCQCLILDLNYKWRFWIIVSITLWSGNIYSTVVQSNECNCCFCFNSTDLGGMVGKLVLVLYSYISHLYSRHILNNSGVLFLYLNIFCVSAQTYMLVPPILFSSSHLFQGIN